MAVDIAATSRRMDTQAAELDTQAATLVDHAKELIVKAQAEADAHMADARERARKIEEQAQGVAEEAEYWRELAASERARAERAKAGIVPDPDPQAAWSSLVGQQVQVTYEDGAIGFGLLGEITGDVLTIVTDDATYRSPVDIVTSVVPAVPAASPDVTRPDDGECEGCLSWGGRPEGCPVHGHLNGKKDGASRG